MKGYSSKTHKRIGYGNCECDFYIVDCNLYIEFWGLMGNKSYVEKMPKKIKVYEGLGLNLLSLYPKDNIQEKLRFLLNYSKTQKKITDYEIPKGVCIITKDEDVVGL